MSGSPRTPTSVCQRRPRRQTGPRPPAQPPRGRWCPGVIALDHTGQELQIAGPCRVNTDLAVTLGLLGLTLVTGSFEDYAVRRTVEWYNACPQPGDFYGWANVEDLVDAYDRCRAEAFHWWLRAVGRPGGVW